MAEMAIILIVILTKMFFGDRGNVWCLMAILAIVWGVNMIVIVDDNAILMFNSNTDECLNLCILNAWCNTGKVRLMLAMLRHLLMTTFVADNLLINFGVVVCHLDHDDECDRK